MPYGPAPSANPNAGATMSPAADGQRNSITNALMQIARPPPQLPLPQMPQQQMHMGMPQMPPPGAPPQGVPPPGQAPPAMPLSAAVPPQPMQMAMGGPPQAPPQAPPGVPQQAPQPY